MHLKPFMLIVSFFLSIGLTEIRAQNTVTASGGNATGGGGSVSYSVGQIVYTTNTATSGSVAQGVQQPYEISVVSGIEDNIINLTCSVFPNPTSDKLTLKVENSEKLKLTYQLFDINGKLLESKRIEGSEITISMGSIAPSIYFLKVTDGIKEVKTFKIIKN